MAPGGLARLTKPLASLSGLVFGVYWVHVIALDLAGMAPGNRTMASKMSCSRTPAASTIRLRKGAMR